MDGHRTVQRLRDMWRTIKIKAERQQLTFPRRGGQGGYRNAPPPPPSPALTRNYPTSSPPPRQLAAMTDSGLGIAPASGTTSAIGQVNTPPYQDVLLISDQYILSNHSLNPPYQPILSTLPLTHLTTPFHYLYRWVCSLAMLLLMQNKLPPLS